MESPEAVRVELGIRNASFNPGVDVADGEGVAGKQWLANRAAVHA